MVHALRAIAISEEIPTPPRERAGDRKEMAPFVIDEMIFQAGSAHPHPGPVHLTPCPPLASPGRSLVLLRHLLDFPSPAPARW